MIHSSINSNTTPISIIKILLLYIKSGSNTNNNTNNATTTSNTNNNTSNINGNKTCDAYTTGNTKRSNQNITILTLLSVILLVLTTTLHVD